MRSPVARTSGYAITTMKKPRPASDDTLADEFSNGDAPPSERDRPSSKPQQAATQKRKDSALMSKLQMPSKEPTVRLTVDLTEPVHRKLSILAAKTGRKKAEIVRFLLDEALKEVED